MRQNTPHPKELKAKAHKLFSKGGQNSSLEESDLQQNQQQDQHHPSQQQYEQPPSVVTEAVNRNVREPLADFTPKQELEQTEVIGNGQEENSEDDDTDDVSSIYSIHVSLSYLHFLIILRINFQITLSVRGLVG